jgi:hypothetical protein
MANHIIYNWRFSEECGEEFGYYTVGVNCDQIVIHYSKHDGDKTYCQVIAGKTKITIFNLNSIEEIIEERYDQRHIKNQLK